MSAQPNDNQQLAERVLSKVQSEGASGDLIIDAGESLSLKARDGELEEYKVTSSQIFGLRVIKDGRVGTAYSEASDSDALESMVEQALINASFARVEEFEKISKSDDTLATDNALLCPTDAVSIDEKIQFSLDLERKLASMDKVKNVPYNGVQDVTGQRQVFTSNGLNAQSKSRTCLSFAYALVEEDDVNAMEGLGQAARTFPSLDVDALVKQVHLNTLSILHGKPVPSKHYDVIFNAETQAEVFHVFASMFSGKSAKDGVNPMRDKVGEAIADPRLTILDNPSLTDGFGYALFDAEGTATDKLALINQGNLASLIHNSATAAYFDTHSTGHASRGPKSTLGVGAHQLEILAGTDGDSSLKAGTYLELVNLTGLHSGANPLSGNFSFGASGYLCKDGIRGQAIRGITVAGNFFDMLNKIAAIGDAPVWDWEHSSLMPSIRFSDLAISG